MLPKTSLFDPEIYRANSLDLAHLDDLALHDHFEHVGFAEPRIFGRTETTSQYLSMKWLRGDGIEIGAGRYPIELFGKAEAINADIDSGALFGTAAVQHRLSVDDPVPAALSGRFDFAIASHVLEHADGLIQAVQNLLDLVRPDGTVYIVVPDVRFLVDVEWMPRFDFAHHMEEYREPGKYNAMHERLAHDHMRRNSATASAGQQLVNGGQVHGDDVIKLLNDGEGGKSRFMNHRHTYDPDGWLGLFVDIQRFLPKRFTFLETRYGMERSDCHFVLRRWAI
jgi:SAM-dependent methyltransferase